jgi:hypothetical protein
VSTRWGKVHYSLRFSGHALLIPHPEKEIKWHPAKNTKKVKKLQKIMNDGVTPDVLLQEAVPKPCAFRARLMSFGTGLQIMAFPDTVQ